LAPLLGIPFRRGRLGIELRNLTDDAFVPRELHRIVSCAKAVERLMGWEETKVRYAMDDDHRAWKKYKYA